MVGEFTNSAYRAGSISENEKKMFITVFTTIWRGDAHYANIQNLTQLTSFCGSPSLSLRLAPNPLALAAGTRRFSLGSSWAVMPVAGSQQPFRPRLHSTEAVERAKHEEVPCADVEALSQGVDSLPRHHAGRSDRCHTLL
eukprot:g65517.t1